MKIFVCMSRVPDTATRVRVHKSGVAVDSEGVQFVVNPFDEFAIEEALRLREKSGGHVTVICIGSADAQKDLRACLAKGCDAAVLLTPPPGAALDCLAVAKILSQRMRDAAPDAIFCGKQSVDDDSAAVGPMLAALLDLPCVTRVCKFAVEGTGFTAAREVEGGLETSTGRFPCVITADKGLNEPRRAGLKEIMGAKNKPLETVALAAVAPGTTVTSLELPPERGPGKIVGEGVGAVPKTIDLLKHEARIL